MTEQNRVRRMVVVEDGLLTTMAMNPQFVSAFPFLASLARPGSQKKPGCSRCGKANAQRVATFGAAKLALATMDGENKRKLKQMLNTQEVRVRYQEGGKWFDKTF